MPKSDVMRGTLSKEEAGHLAHLKDGTEELMRRLRDEMCTPIWVIFHYPKEPTREERYVLQLQVAYPNGGGVRHHSPVYVMPTLEHARHLVPYGCDRLARCEDDSPNIVETWL